MDQTRLNQVDRFIWLLIALTGCCVFAAAAVGPFEIDLSTFWKSALSTTIILFLSWYYMRIRKDALLAAALTSVAQVLTFASVGAPLSYVAASAAMPLWDLQLANLDHQLGFNWAAWLAFMNARPLAHSAFATAYSSFALQVT